MFLWQIVGSDCWSIFVASCDPSYSSSPASALWVSLRILCSCHRFARHPTKCKHPACILIAGSLARGCVIGVMMMMMMWKSSCKPTASWTCRTMSWPWLRWQSSNEGGFAAKVCKTPSGGSTPSQFSDQTPRDTNQCTASGAFYVVLHINDIVRPTSLICLRHLHANWHLSDLTWFVRLHINDWYRS